MSSMKNGFSTLNRWLGKKNKDKSSNNGKFSKSSTNLASLSISSTNINDTSQLDYNRITPLPAATSNAPFEQTFRITVLLPKDQLYVARLGARVPLSKLLQLVCDNKLLDEEKFEFRNPVDPSQVYSCNLTIGAVGLSEIRLCHKTDSYETYNSDEIIKLQRTTIIRDSLSSSEFSSHNSKHTTKTASPYSSTNSLNSMDSAGVGFGTRAKLSLPAATAAVNNNNNNGDGITTTTTTTTTNNTKVIAPPPRKKRTAPRPPSQVMIPEQTALIIESVKDQPRTPTQANNNTSLLPSKNLCVSTPNLAISTNNNHNHRATNSEIDFNVEEKKNARNVASSESLQSLQSSNNSEQLPEPSPRKRLMLFKKKSAPAPPPASTGKEAALYVDDNISIDSFTPSTTNITLTTASTTTTTTTTATTTATVDENVVEHKHVPQPDLIVSVVKTFANDEKLQNGIEYPQPVERVELTNVAVAEQASETQQPITPTKSTQQRSISLAPVELEETSTSIVKTIPKPVPRLTTTMTLLNATPPTDSTESSSTTSFLCVAKANVASQQQQQVNISKVLLNRTPTPEPRSLSCEPPEMDSNLVAQVSEYNIACHSEDDDNVSKQADSGIGEPVPSPVPDSLPSEGSTHESKTFESSSDDDEIIKVYNFKLGKTSKQVSEDDEQQHKTNDSAEFTTSLSISQNEPATVTTTTAAAPTAAVVEKAATVETDEEEVVSTCSTLETTPTVSETTSWNFAIPISPPPNFADNNNKQKPKAAVSPADSKPDSPITPKIKARPVLNFDALAPETCIVSSALQINKDRDVVDRVLLPPVADSTTNSAEVSSFINVKAEKEDEITSSSSLQSPTTPLNELFEELSTVLDKRKGSFSKKTAPNKPNKEIQSAKPNTLTNFSICSIANQQSSLPIEIYSGNINVRVVDTSKTKLTDEEKNHRKRSSVTSNGNANGNGNVDGNGNSNGNGNGKQRKSITRADSFHTATSSSKASTYTEPTSNGLSSRSSSHLSLSLSENASIVAAGGGGARRSSSELSIGESPELQSLEVMKTILNTQSNNLTNSNDTTAMVETNKTHMSETKKITSLEFRPKSDIVTPPNDDNNTNVSQPKSDIPKLYRYSGPPSINFSTWNERPKAQVNIKNEGDYICGGTNATNTKTTASAATTPTTPTTSNTKSMATTIAALNGKSMPRNYRKSMPAVALAEINATNDSDKTIKVIDIARSDSTIKRMGIPETQFRVPVTVKPLQDVTVESVPVFKQTQTQPQQQPQTQPQPKHATATGITKITFTSNNGPISTFCKPSAPQTLDIRPISSVSSHTGTMPRSNANRYSTPVGTGSLRFNHANTITVAPPTRVTNTNAASSSLETKTPTTVVAATPAPFGQNTLRKTGLKEKILQQAEEQQQNVVTITTAQPKLTTAKSLPYYPQEETNSITTVINGRSKFNGVTSTAAFSHQNLQNGYPAAGGSSSSATKSAKIELKLQKSISVPLQSSNVVDRPTTPTTITKQQVKSSVVKPPTPPPKPSNAASDGKAVQAKSSTTSVHSADSRDSLLDAIRNFKRDDLVTISVQKNQ